MALLFLQFEHGVHLLPPFIFVLFVLICFVMFCFVSSLCGFVFLLFIIFITL